jgi:predicted GH43/DUF377 family glycosyl hydrolase
MVALTALPLVLLLHLALTFTMEGAESSCTSHADTDYQCAGPSCDIAVVQDVPTAAACCEMCLVNPRCFFAAWNGPTFTTCYLKKEGAQAKADNGTTGCACVGPRPPPPPPPPVCSNASLPSQGRYAVSVVEHSVVPGGGSLISKANGSSDFQYNFNTAAFPSRPGRQHSAGGSGVAAVRQGLVVRLQDEGLHPEWVNAGALAVVGANFSATRGGGAHAEHVGSSAVLWPGVLPPVNGTNQWGAIDPRIAFRAATGEYYLTWDNCTRNCSPHRQTMLSTSTDPFNHSSWTCHGMVLQGDQAQPLTSGASLLFRDGQTEAETETQTVETAEADATAAGEEVGGDGTVRRGGRVRNATHLAFVSNSNTADRLYLAESTDGISWRLSGGSPGNSLFMAGRPGCWDMHGVASGPQPERLSTGDYLYIYNIDTRSYSLPLGRCAVGWAILDGNNPRKIIARSDKPLLAAALPFEIKGQTPLVIFADGLVALGDDEFIITYGAADTDVGAARIKVDTRAPASEQQ